MSQSKRLALGKTLLTLCCLIVSGTSTTFGQISTPSDGGNPFLHGIGWQTFENVVEDDNNSGISDNTPDSNSTFDATPAGSNNNGHYLTGVIGSGASVLGRQGFGQTTNRFFLNGLTFGSNTVPDGLNIVDVPLADGSAGVRIGPQQEEGTSAWKFRANGNQEFGDFSITNESDFSFRLERIHYDARSGNVNSPSDVEIIYLAAGTSNLLRADNGNEVNDLHVFSALFFAVQPNVRNITASVAGSFNEPTAVRLAPGDSASFRIRWTNSVTDFGEAQIDNLAISGTFLDQNNGFVPINPIDVTTAPSSLGDFDMDGDVDLQDLDQYNGNIGEAATGALAALDLDGDMTVGANDFEQHYTTLVETSNGGKGTFAGDANLDGTVNVLGDAFLLVGNLNNPATSWSQGDFNGDGTVNVLGDAFALVGNLGNSNNP